MKQNPLTGGQRLIAGAERPESRMATVIGGGGDEEESIVCCGTMPYGGCRFHDDSSIVV